MKTTISTRLMHTLYGGKKRLGSEALLRLSRFVESQKTEGDTFVNKSGEVDLYYTSFGWLLSYVLGIDLSMEKRRSYLEKQPVMSLDLVHYAAYMRCVLLHRLMKEGKFRFLLGAMRPMPIRSLTSFMDLPHDDIWSPYTRFIWMSLLEDTQNKENEKKAVLEKLRSYRVKGGGYSNLRDREVATTNATVAALAISGNWRAISRSTIFFIYGIRRMRPVVSKLDEELLFRIFFLRLRPFFLWDAMIYDPLGRFMILLRLIGWIRVVSRRHCWKIVVMWSMCFMDYWH